MKNKSFLTKALILISTATLGVGIFISPSHASIDFLIEYFEVYVDYYQSLTEDISSYFESLGSDFATVMEVARGDLGVIDPQQGLAKIQEKTLELSELSAGEKIIELNSRSSQFNRIQLQANSQTVLSEAGQERTAQKLAFNQSMVNQIQQQQNAVENAVSTHEAIKALAQIMAANASIQGTVQADLLQNQQSQALTNLNIADMQADLSKQTRSKQLNEVNSALYLLKSNPAALTLP